MQFLSNSPLNVNHSTEFESNTALLAPAGAVSATFWQRSLSETVIDSIQRGSAAQAKAGISVKPEPNWCSWWFPWRCCRCYIRWVKLPPAGQLLSSSGLEGGWQGKEEICKCRHQLLQLSLSKVLPNTHRSQHSSNSPRGREHLASQPATTPLVFWCQGGIRKNIPKGR